MRMMFRCSDPSIVTEEHIFNCIKKGFGHVIQVFLRAGSFDNKDNEQAD